HTSGPRPIRTNRHVNEEGRASGPFRVEQACKPARRNPSVYAGCRMVPSFVISMRSPVARPAASVSKYCIEPSSIFMTMRLVEFDSVRPPAAVGTARIDSMRPIPARSGAAAGAAATAGAATTTGAATTAGAAAAGAGADVTRLSVAHPARIATAIEERTRGSLFIEYLL